MSANDLLDVDSKLILKTLLNFDIIACVKEMATFILFTWVAFLLLTWLPRVVSLVVWRSSVLDTL